MVKTILVALAFLSVSCKIQKENSRDEKIMNTEVLSLLVEDNYFPTDSLETSIIKDSKSLQAFFTRVNMTRKPGIPIPAVDFKKDMVVIVCGGKRNGVEGLMLAMGRQTDTTQVIHIKEVPNDTENSSISYPFCVYKMARTEKQISFK